VSAKSQEPCEIVKKVLLMRLAAWASNADLSNTSARGGKFFPQA
jgi:hypothetical protein